MKNSIKMPHPLPPDVEAILKLARPKFEFKFVSEPKRASDIVPSIHELGIKAEQYVRALESLSEAGFKEAEIALRLFQDASLKSNELTVVRRAVESDVVSPPIDTNPGARWKMDKFGLLALQLLL